MSVPRETPASSHEDVSRPRRLTVWIALGLLLAAATAGIGTVPGIVLFVPVLVAVVIAWRRLGSPYRWAGIATFGLALALVFTVASIGEIGCPDKPQHVKLNPEQPEGTIECPEVVRSYASMAVFFGVVGVVGLLIPFYERKRRELEEAERREAALGGPNPDGG